MKSSNHLDLTFPYKENRSKEQIFYEDLRWVSENHPLIVQ
jgi:hypothetical protein